MRAYVQKISVSIAAVAGVLFLVFTGNAVAGEQNIAQGSFEGRSKHVTTGGVSIVKQGGAHVVVLAKDFSLDNAPDPKVGFGRDGKYDISAQLGHLKSKTGAQRYTIPAGVDPAKYNEVYIWCEKYSVPLGVAKLK